MSQYFTNKDILLINLTYLPTEDLFNFCKVNKNICNGILNDQYFWKLRLENRLGLYVSPEFDNTHPNYKYISLYLDNTNDISLETQFLRVTDVTSDRDKNYEVIKILLDNINLNNFSDQQLNAILQNTINYPDITKFILMNSNVNPSGEILLVAVHKGYDEIVKLLLQRNILNLSRINDAIYYAWSRGHYKIFQLLLNDLRVRNKLSSDDLTFYENELSKYL
jgi:hypothetical protein